MTGNRLFLPRDCRPSGKRDFSFEPDLGPSGVVSDKIGHDVSDDVYEFLERLGFDVQTGDVGREDVITVLGFVEADGDDKAHRHGHGGGIPFSAPLILQRFARPREGVGAVRQG
jgi:hypothetical protein